MPNVEYVTAKLEQDDFIERAEEFYLEGGSDDPNRLLQEYAARINADIPEEMDSESFRRKIRTRDKVHLEEFKSVLDSLANQKADSSDLGDLF